jgi:hypothetical protein
MNEIKIKPEDIREIDLGLLFWKLESIEKFYPCYTQLIKEKR